MYCKHCGFANGEDDHRCLRCGRRIAGVVIAAPPGYSGANALAPSLMLSEDTADFQAGSIQTPAQPASQPFLSSNPPKNIIPFDRRERNAMPKAEAQQPPPSPQQRIHV